MGEDVRMTLRSVVERMTHRLVVRRALPTPFAGSFYVSSEAGLRYLKPTLRDVDPTLLRLVDELVSPGDVVWDIGANVGLFTFTAASKVGTGGRVVAVDADTYNVGLLRRSASRHGWQVDVVSAAVSDQNGLATFHIASRNRSTNALDGYGSTQMGGIRQTQIVPTVTLDLLADHFPAPDVLKIDIEGAEVLALTGGPSVLSKGPTIICEVTMGNAERVAKVLRRFGYTFEDGDIPAPRSAVDLPPFTLVARQTVIGGRD